MSKNKLTDLNNHLFAQMERLSDEYLEGEDLEKEIQRTKAVTDVSKQIVSNANLALRAQRLMDDGQLRGTPPMLAIGPGSK